MLNSNFINNKKIYIKYWHYIVKKYMVIISKYLNSKKFIEIQNKLYNK